MGLACSQAGAVTFSDDFEDGLGDWTNFYGALNISTAQNHTPSGSQAAMDDNDGTAQCMKHVLDNDNAVQGTLSVWYYDPGTSDVRAMVDAYGGTDATRMMIGVVNTTEDDYYQYRLGGTEYTTTIARSTGWHEFEYVIDDSGTTGYIDDTQIFAWATATSITEIRIGTYWSGTGTGDDVFFDDVNFVPEPATMALLGFGGIGLLIRRRRMA